MSEKLRVNRPCSENPDTMQQTSDGLYCQSCKHLVHDFREMHTDDIIRFIQSKKGEKVCGVFQAAQTGVPFYYGLQRPFRYAAALVVSVFGVNSLSAASAFKFEKTETITQNTDSTVWRVTGKITDRKTGSGLYGVEILVKGTKGKAVLAVTRADGTFEFTITTATDDTATITLKKYGYFSKEISYFDPSAGNVVFNLKKNPKEKIFRTVGCPSF